MYCVLSFPPQFSELISLGMDEKDGFSLLNLGRKGEVFPVHPFS